MFEDIKHIDEHGREYWYARELMPLLQYKEWRFFEAVIQNANARHKSVALGKTYFAIKARQQEISEKEYSLLTETDLLTKYSIMKLE